MPRYVLLEHDYPALHWDFMLEADDVLRTWRLASLPRVDEAVRASATFDHRPLYLDYEGPISGNRGRVFRWDAGTFVWQINTPNEVNVCVTGERLHGPIRLAHVGGEEWTLHYKPDA